jgi:hypothetical protein
VWLCSRSRLCRVLAVDDSPVSGMIHVPWH